MKRLLSALALFAVASPAAASPLNPWGAYVGDGVTAVTPFLYVDQSPRFYPYVYGQHGFGPKLELLAGVGASFGSGPFTFDSVEVMPRYFFTDSGAVALHATWANGGGTTLAAEYDGAYEFGSFALTVNVGYGPTFYDGGVAPGDIYALLAPEFYFTDATSLFVEVDPTYTLGEGGGLYMEVVPGVSTAIADTHYFALGLALPVAPEFDSSGIYVGAWYSVAFGGS